jgi:hypothetical protein
VFATSASVDHLWMQFDHDFGIRCQQLLHVLLHALNQQQRLARTASMAVGGALRVPRADLRVDVWRRWFATLAPARLGLGRGRGGGSGCGVGNEGGHRGNINQGAGTGMHCAGRVVNESVLAAHGTPSHVTSYTAHLRHPRPQSHSPASSDDSPVYLVRTGSALYLPSVASGSVTTYLIPFPPGPRALNSDIEIVSNIPGPFVSVSMRAIASADLPLLDELLSNASAVNRLHSDSVLDGNAHSNANDQIAPHVRIPFAAWSRIHIQSSSSSCTLDHFHVAMPPSTVTFEERFALRFDAARVPTPSDALAGSLWRIATGGLECPARIAPGVAAAHAGASDNANDAADRVRWVLEIKMSPGESAWKSRLPSSSSSSSSSAPWSHFLTAQMYPSAPPASQTDSSSGIETDLVPLDARLPLPLLPPSPSSAIANALGDLMGPRMAPTGARAALSFTSRVRVTANRGVTAFRVSGRADGHDVARIRIVPLSPSPRAVRPAFCGGGGSRNSGENSNVLPRFEPALFWSAFATSGWKQNASELLIPFHLTTVCRTFCSS